ncbi:MAG: MBL fold metallo-hydrolase [Chitinivibrionales bacterium]|nr:MBL fold metallo-hydrolase [Chitinivibrionales bacterium]MBD3394995.1 MBL fold metallo-hydrolase [Chitinivibrionales bacterium]
MIIPLKLGFVTVFALRGSRTVLVDTGYAGSEEAILTKLGEYGIAKDDVSLILITHGHTDHFGSVAALHESTGAPVGVHPADAEFVRAGKNPPVKITARVNRLVKLLIDEKAAKKIAGQEPDVYLENGMSLERYGVEGTVVATPGHTAGSVSIIRADGDALIGDLLMGKLVHPQQPRWPFFADDIRAVRESLQALYDRGVQQFHASHGGPFSRKRIADLLSAGDLPDPGT